MPNVQSPYAIAYGSAAGSVYTIDCGGLTLTGAVLLSGTAGVITLETTNGVTSTYGTLTTLQNGAGVGTAATLTIAALGQPYRYAAPLGPVYDLRATIAGSVQTAGTLAVYLRG
jgi:hypothetical protein